MIFKASWWDVASSCRSMETSCPIPTTSPILSYLVFYFLILPVWEDFRICLRSSHGKFWRFHYYPCILECLFSLSLLSSVCLELWVAIRFFLLFTFLTWEILKVCILECLFLVPLLSIEWGGWRGVVVQRCNINGTWRLPVIRWNVVLKGKAGKSQIISRNILQNDVNVLKITLKKVFFFFKLFRQMNNIWVINVIKNINKIFRKIMQENMQYIFLMNKCEIKMQIDRSPFQPKFLAL